jgi:hypothetical protein
MVLHPAHGRDVMRKEVLIAEKGPYSSEGNQPQAEKEEIYGL